MKLHILGCGDAFGSGGRNQSGYLVEAADRLFLLDCGPTTLLAMKRAGIDPRRLDAIILSHLHGDHFGGIPFFFDRISLSQTTRTSPLTIAGPPGTEERVRQLFDADVRRRPRQTPVPPVIRDFDSRKSCRASTDIEVFPFRVPHQIE